MVGGPSPVQQALHHRRTGGSSNNSNIHAGRDQSGSLGMSNPSTSTSMYTLPNSSGSSFTPGEGEGRSRAGVGIGVGMGSLMAGGRGGGGSAGVTMGSTPRALQAQQQALHQRHQAQQHQLDQDLSQRQQQLHQHGRGTQINEHFKLESPSSLSSATSSPRGVLFSPTSAGPGGPKVGGGGGAGPDNVSAAAAVVAAQQEESEGVQQVRHLLRVRQAMLGGVGAMPGAVGSSGPDLVGGTPSAAPMLLARVGRTSSFDQQQQQHLQNSDDTITGSTVIDTAAAAGIVTAVAAAGAPPTLGGGAALPLSTGVTDNDNTSDIGTLGAGSTDRSVAGGTAPQQVASGSVEGTSDAVGLGWETSSSADAAATAAASAVLDHDFWGMDDAVDTKNAKVAGRGAGGEGEATGGRGVTPSFEGMMGDGDDDGIGAVSARGGGTWGFEEREGESEGGGDDVVAERLRKRPRFEECEGEGDVHRTRRR